MKMVFVDKEAMKEEAGWMKDTGTHLESVSICGEVISVNKETLEIERARGYENFISTLLQSGKVRITD